VARGRLYSVLLTAAVAYVGLGWGVIPIRARTKKPPFAWKVYQGRLPEPDELASWFSDGSTHELAIICGEVSGGLVVVDFDSMAYYERWAKAHPDLAAKLPTVRTKRGRHVYFRSSHRKTRRLKDGDHEWGEIRAEGAYVLAPPSRHPEGGAYKWLIEPDGELPYLELTDLGLDAALLPDGALGEERTEETEETEGGPEDPEAIGRAGGTGQPEWLLSLPALLSSSVSSADICGIERAIADTQPAAHGQRNARVFDLCRALKAIPVVADRPWQELIPIVREWFRRASPRVRTRDVEATVADFAHGWPRVEVPKEVNWMEKIVTRAKEAPEPACVAGLGMPRLSLLGRICVELQRAVGDRPFHLSCRKAGELLGIPHHQANRFLGLLVDIGLIEIAEPGNQGRATRYRLIEEKARP